MIFTPPPLNCNLCPRLCSFRSDNRRNFSHYHNAPVESFGSLDAAILIVGLAPGLHGANQTGRPFTNDYAGDILYPTLKAQGLAQGTYQKHRNDGFELLNVRITNAVRCVPPQNKPLPTEEQNCRQFLKTEIAAMPNLQVILCLGAIAHKNVLKSLDLKQSAYKFSHGATHVDNNHNLTIVDSYHTSRYNINTGVLTQTMFASIIAQVKGLIK